MLAVRRVKRWNRTDFVRIQSCLQHPPTKPFAARGAIVCGRFPSAPLRKRKPDPGKGCPLLTSRGRQLAAIAEALIVHANDPRGLAGLTGSTMKSFNRDLHGGMTSPPVPQRESSGGDQVRRLVSWATKNSGWWCWPDIPPAHV